MRAWLLLAAASLLLPLASPAQAFEAGALLTPEDDGDGGGSSSDPCLSLAAALENPKYAVVILTQCTLRVILDPSAGTAGVALGVDGLNVTVVSTVRQDGTLMVEVIVAYAQHEEEFVLDCSRPGGFIPTFPVRERDYSCWRDPAWD